MLVPIDSSYTTSYKLSIVTFALGRTVQAQCIRHRQTLVQAFISCRLDYCNSLFYGIAKYLMSRLQSVQNAAARLVSGARRYELRLHHASAAGVALASGSTSGGFPDGHPGLPVTVPSGIWLQPI